MATAPTSDVGRPDQNWGGSTLLTDWYETAADLLWPTSVTTYGRMRHDPQLKAILAGYRMPLMRATWALDPDGCRDEVVKHVADDLGMGILGTDMKPGPARRRGVIWHRHLKEALGYLTFGHMPFERRYEYDSSGAAHLVNLGARSPWTIAEMKIDDHGVLESITQNTQRAPLAANRLVWYANDMEGANWAGTSILRAAFGAWLLKHETWRVHATSIRRFGMGVPMVEAPPGATQAQVAQAQQLASSMRSGDSAGMGVPQGFKASLMGMTGSTPDAIGFIRYLDQSMAKMMLEGFLELGQTQSGSRALGESFLDLFNLALQSVADEVATTATSGGNGLSGIVTDLVDQNWGDDEPAPRIVCTDVGENYDITAESLNSLVTSGVVTPDAGLDEWVRKTWRLPNRTDKWTPKGGTPPALPGPGGQGGLPVGKPKPDAPQGGGDQAKPKPEDVQPVKKTAAAARTPTRAQADYIEASQWEPGDHQADWENALAALLLKYRAVMSAQRTDLVDRVIAAMQSGNGERGLVLAAPGTGQGPDLVTQAMVEVARKAAQSMVDEALRQGVHIDIGQVGINATAMGGTAQARAEFHAGWMAQQATAKALQVYGPTPEGYLRAADEVDNYLSGLSDASIRDQLGAALTAAQNHGRLAVLEAAEPQAKAVYVAAEFLDKNTCDHCRKIDGAEFDTIEAATAAYPTGGYAGCEGLMRCRGTVVAVWGDNPPTPGSGRYPYKSASVSAKFNPLQPRDPHSGKWWRTGGAIKQTIEQFTDDHGNWTPERSSLHDRIVDNILSGHSPQEHPVATYFGGGPASGKSSLTSAAPDAAKIDPDEIKMSHLPEYEQMKRAGRKDAAAMVHEESSHVAKLAVQRAQERKLNFVLDGTGDSNYEKMAKKVKAAKAAGYTVHGRYVTLDTAEALRRSESRARHTGRVVPEPYLIATHASVSRVFDQAIKDGLFDGTELFDNNVPKGKPARKIAELGPDGEFRVFDQKAYDKFLAKGVTAAAAKHYGAMTGDDATAILQAVLMGRTFADSGVPNTADARKLWADMERAVEDMPDGMIPDIPAEWPDVAEPGTRASAGDDAPKVPGGDPPTCVAGENGLPHGPHVHPDDGPCPGYQANLQAVGPKGYIHNWIFVGVPFADSSVYHPGRGFGHGKVTHVGDDGTVHIKFDNGKEHSFKNRHDEKRKRPKFEKRTDPPAPDGYTTVFSGNEDDAYDFLRGKGASAIRITDALEKARKNGSHDAGDSIVMHSDGGFTVHRKDHYVPSPKHMKRPPKSDKQLGSWFSKDAKPVTQAAVAAIYGDAPSRWYTTYTEDNPQWLGVMGWDGRMGLRPEYARSAADALDPDAKTRTLEGIKTYWHEVHHAIGTRASKAGKDSADYQTKPGWAIEEGYTELGAWLTMPAFMKAMGIYDKPRYPKYGGKRQDERSIGQAFDDWNDPLTFTGHSTMSTKVSYAPQVQLAYEWLDGIATMEGGDHAALSTYHHDRIKRVTELSIEVNRASGPAKRDVMVDQYLRAKGITLPDTDHGRIGRKSLADQIAVFWDEGKLESTDQPGVFLVLDNRLGQLRKAGYLEDK